MPTFAQPVWLAAGLSACCGAVFFMLFSAARRKKRLAQFAAPHLLPLLTANVSSVRRRLKNICFILGLACVFLALARPQLGSHVIEIRSRGIDILVAFDVSKSMLAQDIKPNRLERAKLALRDFAARLDGDRIGLLPFAGASFLFCPLTTDYEVFADSLAALNTETIPKGGTSIGAVIREAVNVLAADSNHKILLLLTDGEDLGQDALNAAALAQQAKMLIYTVGVGTAQGELIPLPGGGGNFVKDERGGFVTSKLDEQTLTAVAETAGGMYVPLGAMGEGLDAVYERKLAMIPKEEQAARKKNVPTDRFQWPLAAAVVFFSLEFLLIGRRGILRLPFIMTAGRRRKQQAAALLLCCGLCAPAARADEGGELFRAGKYKESAAWYQNRMAEEGGSPVLHFNLGAALHKLGQHDAAAEEFRRALSADDLSLQEKSYYNQGVSQYAAGIEAEQAEKLPQAVQQLLQAEESLKAALSLNTKRDNAARLLRQAEERRRQLEQRLKEPSAQPKGGSDKDSPEQRQDKQDSQHSDSKPSPPENNEKARPRPNEQERQEQPPQEKNAKSASGGQNSQEPPPPAPEQKQPDKTAGKPEEQGAASGQEQNQPPDGQGKEEAKIMGKMTEEEARSLLDSLKGEQGELNFIPQEAADSGTVGRDW
jgi:Ca-activated chloride channel family protein